MGQFFILYFNMQVQTSSLMCGAMLVAQWHGHVTLSYIYIEYINSLPADVVILLSVEIWFALDLALDI